jgi:uncharacterized membrane protein (UPF0127 family)
MSAMKLLHLRSGKVLAERLEIPRTMFGRGWGLMFRARLEVGGGMWITPCNGIHMWFMRFPIDAVFLDRQERVVKVYPRLRRWAMVPLVWGAHSVLELPAGTVDGINLEKGEQLVLTG